MKISVGLLVVQSLPRWVVSWKSPGSRRERRYFKSKAEAEKEKKALETQHREAGTVWLAIDNKERTEVGLLMVRARERGYTLRQACDFFEAGGTPGTSTSLESAFDKFLKERQDPKRGLSSKTVMALKSNIGRFVSGREKIPLLRITRDNLSEYLQNPKWGPRTYNSYLTSFNTFFRWCVKAELVAKNPAASLDKIGKKQMPDLDVAPAVLSSEQALRLLRAALESDRGLIPYIAVGMFAGLRPMKEAGRLLASDIEDKHILVRGSSAKDRQRRHVEIHPALKAWLDLCGDLKDKLPVKNLRRRFEEVRVRAGLIKRVEVADKERLQIEATGWEQDCLRHTFASHYLPVYGAEKTIEQMGHGDYSMLFTHYRRLIAKEEAEKFWSDLTPEKLIPSLFDAQPIVVHQAGDDVAAQAGNAGVAKLDNDTTAAGQAEVGVLIEKPPSQQTNPEAGAHGALQHLEAAA